MNIFKYENEKKNLFCFIFLEFKKNRFKEKKKEKLNLIN